MCHLRILAFLSWLHRLDLNQGPSPYQDVALTGLSYDAKGGGLLVKEGRQCEGSTGWGD